MLEIAGATAIAQPSLQHAEAVQLHYVFSLERCKASLCQTEAERQGRINLVLESKDNAYSFESAEQKLRIGKFDFVLLFFAHRQGAKGGILRALEVGFNGWDSTRSVDQRSYEQGAFTHGHKRIEKLGCWRSFGRISIQGNPYQDGELQVTPTLVVTPHEVGCGSQ